MASKRKCTEVGETPEQWRNRVLREHGPIPERVVTEVRRIFTVAAERRVREPD